MGRIAVRLAENDGYHEDMREPVSYQYRDDPMRALYSEFRWQRRMILGLIAIMLLGIMSMMWWTQTMSSRNTALVTPQTTTSTGTTGSTSSGLDSAVTTPVTASTTAPTLSCANGNCVSLETVDGIMETGNINISGTSRAARFIGDGSKLSNINAVTLDGRSAGYFNDASHLTSGSINKALVADAFAALQPSDNTAVATTPDNLQLESLSLNTALPVSSGGTGVKTLAAGRLLVGNGSGPITALAGGSEGQCLVVHAGGPDFMNCPGGDLQSDFDNGGSGSTIVTSSGHPNVSIQAGPSQDNNQLFMVKSAGGVTKFAVASATGAVTVGGGGSDGQLTVRSNDAGAVTAVLQAAASQTANLVEARASNGQTVASIDAQGNGVFHSVTQTSGTASLAGLSLSGDTTALGSMGIGIVSSSSARLQLAASSAQTGLRVKGSAGQVGDLLQLQDSTGTNLLRVTANGSLLAPNLELAGSLKLGSHIVTTDSSAPLIGTLLSGIVPAITGNDTVGSINLTTSLGATAGILAHVTFTTPYTSVPKVIVSPTSAAAVGLGVYVLPGLSGFDVIAPAAPLTANLYTYNYIVVQ